MKAHISPFTVLVGQDLSDATMFQRRLESVFCFVLSPMYCRFA
eukprot:COSAG02_NODE_14736_length_1241_cov_2.683888_2_plen_42_part_01